MLTSIVGSAGDREIGVSPNQCGCRQPLVRDGPRVEAQNAPHTMVDRANAVGPMRRRAWRRQHPVAVGNQIDRVGGPPINAVLLERIEPVDQNLGVGPERVRGVRSLDAMLMQEGHGRLDDPHVG